MSGHARALSMGVGSAGAPRMRSTAASASSSASGGARSAALLLIFHGSHESSRSRDSAAQRAAVGPSRIMLVTVATFWSNAAKWCGSSSSSVTPIECSRRQYGIDFDVNTTTGTRLRRSASRSDTVGAINVEASSGKGRTGGQHGRWLSSTLSSMIFV